MKIRLYILNGSLILIFGLMIGAIIKSSGFPWKLVPDITLLFIVVALVLTVFELYRVFKA